MRKIKFKHKNTIIVEKDEEYTKLKKKHIPKDIKNKTGIVEQKAYIPDPIPTNIVGGGENI